MKLKFMLAIGTAVLVGAGGSANAAPIYLNESNMSVALGASMSAEPFANRTTAESLSNMIDAPTATSTEFHTQPSHVWVSGGNLEVDFDLGTEYDLTTLHFWNYTGESFDVDDIDFLFYNGSKSFVGSILNVAPALGSGSPIAAEDIDLAFPSNVRYINAVFSGSNGEVDFNNIGFTGELSVIPEPGTLALLIVGATVIGAVRLRRKR